MKVHLKPGKLFTQDIMPCALTDFLRPPFETLIAGPWFTLLAWCTLGLGFAIREQGRYLFFDSNMLKQMLRQSSSFRSCLDTAYSFPLSFFSSSAFGLISSLAAARR